MSRNAYDTIQVLVKLRLFILGKLVLDKNSVIINGL